MFSVSDDGVIQVEGRVSAEAVDDLLETLDANPTARAVDLSGCTHLHTAGVQLLMRRGLEVAQWPASSAWTEWLKSGLER
jgi:hypothetical protein